MAFSIFLRPTAFLGSCNDLEHPPAWCVFQRFKGQAAQAQHLPTVRVQRFKRPKWPPFSVPILILKFVDQYNKESWCRIGRLRLHPTQHIDTGTVHDCNCGHRLSNGHHLVPPTCSVAPGKVLLCRDSKENQEVTF